MAALVSWTGSFVQDVAERWLMLDLTASPFAVAMLSTVFMAASMIMLLPGGILADRFDRRKLVILSQVIQVFVSASVCVLTMLGRASPALLLAGAAVAGLGMALGSPAWSALVPRLVPRTLAAEAIALNAVAFNIARALGPAVGGALLARFGPAAAFGLNAFSFCAVIAAMLPYPVRPREASSESVQVHAVSEDGADLLRAPLRLLLEPGPIRGATLAMMVFTPGCAVTYALLPAFAKASLAAGATSYGLMLGAMGLGAVLGAAVLRRVRLRGVAPGKIVPVTMGIYALSTMALSQVEHVPLALVLLVPSGVGWLGTFSSLQALVQVWTPDVVRARVLSFYLMAHFALWAVFAAIGGVIAERVSIRASIALGGILCACAALLTTRADLPRSFVAPEP